MRFSELYTGSTPGLRCTQQAGSVPPGKFSDLRPPGATAPRGGEALSHSTEPVCRPGGANRILPRVFFCTERCVGARCVSSRPVRAPPWRRGMRAADPSGRGARAAGPQSAARHGGQQERHGPELWRRPARPRPRYGNHIPGSRKRARNGIFQEPHRAVMLSWQDPCAAVAQPCERERVASQVDSPRRTNLRPE